MSDGDRWFAAYDDRGDGTQAWRPRLYVAAFEVCAALGVWFSDQPECDQFIRDHLGTAE